MRVSGFYVNSKLNKKKLTQIFIIATIVEFGVDMTVINYILKQQEVVQTFRLGGF